MADKDQLKAPTNNRLGSVAKLTVDCNVMWSMAQEFCYARLAEVSKPDTVDLVDNYAVRARRISGTYARFYLETEDNGNPKHKGRYYWMALAAFASKTVACTLELKRVRLQAVAIDTVRNGLGKGNLWLFCDIAGWHIYYNKFNTTFEMCRDLRNTDTLVSSIKKATKLIQWNGEALPKINNLKVTKEIKLAFEKVEEFESAGEKKQPAIQMEHLLAIADHEQGTILQPLVYDDKDFAGWVQKQRSVWLNWAAPDLQLVFNSACETDKAELKSVAPKDTKLENLESRMDWIRTAVKQFHGLMRTDRAYMEGEIATMAGWYNMADK